MASSVRFLDKYSIGRQSLVASTKRKSNVREVKHTSPFHTKTSVRFAECAPKFKARLVSYPGRLAPVEKIRT